MLHDLKNTDQLIAHLNRLKGELGVIELILADPELTKDLDVMTALDNLTLLVKFRTSAGLTRLKNVIRKAYKDDPVGWYSRVFGG